MSGMQPRPIPGAPARRAANDRVDGYLKAMAAAGLSVDETLIAPGGFEYPTAFAACAQLFDRDDPPTAVFAASDSMATAIINALHRRRVRVPEDVSIVGANDDLLAIHVEPQLTTIRPPITSAGQRAAELILAAIGQRGPRAPIREVLTSELVIRASTAPLSE